MTNTTSVGTMIAVVIAAVAITIGYTIAKKSDSLVKGAIAEVGAFCALIAPLLLV